MAFNSSHSGALTCSELYGGLLWLGMRVDPPLIHDIVRTVDLDCDGYVSWPEFKKAFSSTGTKTTVRADGTVEETDDQDADILEMGSNSDRSQWPAAFDDTDGSNSSAFTVPPKAMPELYEIYNANRKRDAAAVETVEEMKAERLEAFKVKVQKQDKVECVWTTHSTGARAKCSIWSPDIGGKKLISRNRVRVVLGHYARPGLSGFGRKDTDIEPMIVEITDTGKSRLSHGKKIDVIVDTLFPHPIRFREVWKQEGGAKSLYIWKPVPPNSAFVVLGMVATNTDEPPKNDTVRCIPRRWTVPTTLAALSVGTCMHAVIGHEAPSVQEDDLFDIKSSRFFLSHEEVAEIEATGTPASNAGQASSSSVSLSGGL
eukprot:11654-Heterococcus_DN1.PRE.1